MHAVGTSKPVVRETLLVLSNYLAQGMSYNLAREAFESIHKNTSIIDEPFYTKEILYVLLNFIKIAQHSGICFKQDDQLLQAAWDKMSQVTFTAEDL